MLNIIEIFNQTDFNLFESFVNEWMLVLEKLIPCFDLGFIDRVLLL